jgi:hypothetical protein
VTDDDQEYCRSVEAYLCRKNDGHLVRIVGPAFDRVCDWAERGVPLKVAFRGIDRYFERYYAKGPRRRPVRVEFCEADVLDVFDEWRRAVGVSAVREARGRYADGHAPGPGVGDEPPGDESLAANEEEPAGRPRGSLPSHLDRAIARLAPLRCGPDPPLAAALEEIVPQLEAMRGDARGLRGAARQAALERLRECDARLLEAARQSVAETAWPQVRAEAEDELAPFRARMPPDAYAKALAACIDKIIRDRARLPTLAFE